MIMPLAPKKCGVFMLAAILSACFIQFFCTNLSADDRKAAENVKTVAKFMRAIQRVDGSGGFAYQGIREKLQIQDYALAGIQKRPQPSAWLENRKKAYTDLLINRKYDILIVPFQTQWDGVDAIGRALMSYRLAIEIEKRTAMRVAPMPLVHQALGYTSRMIDDDQVYALARQIGCRHIIWGFAGTHENSFGHVQSLDITIAEQGAENFGSEKGIRSKSWTQLDITSNQLPSILFEKKVSEALDFLGFPKKATVKAVSGSDMGSIEFPQTPAALFESQVGNSIHQSYLFQFMGMLIPARAEFQRQYMFIRSLCALTDADTSHPDYEILKARAYFHLHRRPAALEVLMKNQSPGAAFLKHLLNGNLAPLKDSLDRINSPLQKFLAAVEYLDLKERYTSVLDKDLIKSMVSQFPQWDYFFNLILNDPNAWDLRDNVPLKQCLDTYFPVQAFSLEDLVHRQSLQMAPEKLAAVFDLSFQEHIRRRLASEPRIDLLSDNQRGPGAIDYLLMLEGIGQSNLVKRVQFFQDVQGLPNEALKSCNQFLKSFDGHPHFTLLHAGILEEQAGALQGEQKAQILKTAYNEARDGLWWYGGQGWAYHEANFVLSTKSTSDLRKSDDSKHFMTFLYSIACDYPPRPDCASIGNMRPYEDLIDWSTHRIGELKALVTVYSKLDPGKARELITSKLSGRFLGHPQRHTIDLAEQAMDSPTADPKVPYLQEISQGTRVWKIYESLGKLYIDDGQYAKARDVFLSYPGFAKGAPENPVALSNRAYFMGSYLFWQGAHAEARPLYEFSAGLQTGSQAGLTSQARVALLDRDFPTAAQLMLHCAQRYDDSHRYRDYMTFLHLMGASDDAWQMFPTLLGRYPKPHIWTSAFVGHRLRRTGKKDLERWIRDMARQNQTSRERSFPARFALLCLLDRAPDFEFASHIDTIDDLTRYQIDNYTVRGPDEKKALGPEPFESLNAIDTDNPQDLFEAKKRYYTEAFPDKLFSFYGSFARAYEHLKNKEYTESYRILKERSRLYSYEVGALGAAFKPYLVWAGLKSGHRKEMDHFMYPFLVMGGLQKPQPEIRGYLKFFANKYDSVKRFEFDDELALAIYLGWTGDHDAALDRLHKAFNIIPYTDKRPLFPWYQMIEACEWLYESSTDQRYLALALKHAKNYQVIQPMFAWAFAFEAKYTQDQNDKMRALGYALYLDPQSWRLADFTEPARQAACDRFKGHNPFLSKPIADLEKGRF